MNLENQAKQAFRNELQQLRVLLDGTRSEHQKIIKWIDGHYFASGKVGKAVAFVLPTRACKYARAGHGGCSFCTLPTDNPMDPSLEDLQQLPERAYELFVKEQSQDPSVRAVKFYTSGSFFDPWELPEVIRAEILQKFNPIVDEIIVENRCEYVIKKHIEHSLKYVAPEKLIVAIGQESTDNEINERANNKGHTLKQFHRAAKLLQSYNVRVKGYILLKPIFISELAAVHDALQSARDMHEIGVNSISINSAYIGKGTLMEKLFYEHRYTPPWLWSVLNVTKAIKELVGDSVSVICDPIAAGKERGPQNCGRCDAEFKAKLKAFSTTQDIQQITGLHCSCQAIYDTAIATENLYSGFGVFKLPRH